ncbi:MAG: beta-galactosidase trimerization domain-containing protein, partial [Victivallales bacterium]
LKVYVKQGGTLILSGRQMSAELKPEAVAKFLGIKIKSQWHEIYGRTKCNLCGETFEELRFAYTPIDTSGAEIIATADSGRLSPVPIITQNKVGKGKVIYIAPYYGQQLWSRALMEITVHMLDHVYEKQQLVKIEGKPGQYLVNKQKNGLWVTLINNSDKKWQGTVNLKDNRCIIAATELWKDEELEIEKNKVFISIEPLQFKIVEVISKVQEFGARTKTS